MENDTEELVIALGARIANLRSDMKMMREHYENRLTECYKVMQRDTDEIAAHKAAYVHLRDERDILLQRTASPRATIHTTKP